MGHAHRVGFSSCRQERKMGWILFERLGPCMTLAAVILLIQLSWTAACANHFYLSEAESSQPVQDQGTAQPQAPAAEAKQPPATTNPSKPPAPSPQPAKKPIRKKKSTSADCQSAAPAGS